MKIFKAENAMNFNILNGNNNKLNIIRNPSWRVLHA